MLKKELSMAVRKRISKIVAERYCRSAKREKKDILDEFVKTTGYVRCYASWLLRHLGKKQVLYLDKKRYVIVGEKRSQKKVK